MQDPAKPVEDEGWGCGEGSKVSEFSGGRKYFRLLKRLFFVSLVGGKGNLSLLFFRGLNQMEE